MVPKRGWILWVMLAALVAPGSAQVKKQMYQAPVIDELGSEPNVDEFQVGQGMLIVSAGAVDYLIREDYLGIGLDKVTLGIDGDPAERRIVLCDDDGGVPCDSGSFIDLEGTLTAAMFMNAENGAVSPSAFMQALAAGHVTIQFNDGDAGTGTFSRIF